MFSRIASRIVKRASSRASAMASDSGAHLSSAFASFSSMELVPGIGLGKTSTGIVGLPADPDACAKIVTKYQAILDRMAASDLPETAQYRIDMEKISRYRIEMAITHGDDPEMVEELCRCGQVEELVQQADDEMIVLDMYLKERLWEAIADADVEIEYNPDPAKDGDGVVDDDVK